MNRRTPITTPVAGAELGRALRTTVGVAALPKAGRVEIDAIVAVG